MLTKLCRPRPRRRFPQALGVAASLALAAPPVWPVALYDFTSIARDGANGVLSVEGQAPGIASDGTVVFNVRDDGQGGVSIRTGTGGAHRIVVDSRGTFDYVDRPTTSDSGLIAFWATEAVRSGLGVYVIDKNDVITTIARPGDAVSGGILESPNCLGSRCQVANDGTVAFLGALEGGARGVYAGNGGPLSTVAEDTIFNSVQDFNITINNSGQRGVMLDIFLGGETVRISDAAGNNDLVVSVGSTPLADIHTYALNDAGALALVATTDTGRQGVFLVGNTGVISTVADDSGPYASFGNVAINDFGQVAFSATLDAGGGSGVFTGPDPVADKVLAAGDFLFSRTVTFASVGREALNEAGRIALLTDFDDQRARVVRANPTPQIGEVDPDLLDKFAQMSTLGGTGVGMSQAIPFPGVGALFDLSFDLEFLTTTGELSIVLGGLMLGTLGPNDSGPVLFSGINGLDLIGSLPGAPSTILLEFLLSGPPGATLRIDNIVVPGIQNGDFQDGYFESWSFDTSQGGAAVVSALDTAAVPEPGSAMLLCIGLAFMAAGSWRAARR